MPKQFGPVLTSVAMIAIVVASNRADEFAANRPPPRGPASVPAPAWSRHTEKLHGPVNVAIDLVGAPPATGETFVLKGRISSDANLRDVEYHWSLPKSVALLNGIPRGRLTEVAVDRPVELELTLRALDGDNAQVHLLASARARGARFAESAQYNTTREAAIVAGRARLMKSTAASRTTSPDSLKIFH